MMHELDVLIDAVRQVAAGDDTVRIAVPEGDDQLVRLAHAINHLLDQRGSASRDPERTGAYAASPVESGDAVVVELGDDDDRASGTISVGVDVTEQRRSEAERRQNEALLEEVQRVARLGYYTLDVKSGVWTSSPLLDEIFGIPPDYARTVEGWLELVHPEDRDMMSDYLWTHVLEARQPFDREYRIQRREDGEVRWVQGYGRLEYDDRGKPDRMLGTIQDITERHVLEEQLAQSQKLESIGLLAGGVAHDFNNSLTVILGSAELLKSELTDDALRQYALDIEQSAERSRDVTRQLLAFSRREVFEPRTMDPGVLVEEILDTLSRLVGDDVELCYRPSADLWKVHFDRTQLERILVNLAINSRDAMPEGGVLRFEVENTEVEANDDRRIPELEAGQYVMLTVVDDGIGMDEATLSRIFEPFFTTKEMGRGTGLGLSTVFGIVRQNEGHLTVQSELGRGTTFRLYMPRSPEEERAQPVATAQPRRGVSGVVLLVEDDPLVRDTTRRLLEQIGCSVVVSDSASDALSLCAREDVSIDLLLTDVVMPEMSGAELGRRIEALRPHVPTLFTSGYTANVIAQHGLLQEDIHFLQKPFTVESLARKLAEVMVGGTSE